MEKILERIAVSLEEIAIGLNYLRRLENEERRRLSNEERIAKDAFFKGK